MPYLDFDGSSSTLSAGERAREAMRILRRIEPTVTRAELRGETVSGWTDGAQKFIVEQLGYVELAGSVGTITPNQLAWLRSLAEKVD